MFFTECKSQMDRQIMYNFYLDENLHLTRL